MKSNTPGPAKLSAKVQARDKRAGMTRSEVLTALEGVPEGVQLRVDVGLGGQIRALRMEWTG